MLIHPNMIIPELISLITPCYNTAHLIGNLLDSVLAQDYPKVQMIIIDDGSTDNCRDVVIPIKKIQGKGV